MSTKTLDQRIVISPDVCGGKPRINGHRITVENVVVWYDRLGWSADKIASEYNLDLSDIYTALAYYFSNREKVDQSIADDLDFINELRQKYLSMVDQKLQR